MRISEIIFGKGSNGGSIHERDYNLFKIRQVANKEFSNLSIDPPCRVPL